LVFESRLWHATGPNTTTSGERPVILMFFMRSFVRQQENNFLSIRPEVEATMSDRVRRMLGYVTDGAFGGLEGEVREGRYVKRLTHPVGPFRDTHKHTPFRQDVGAPAAAGNV
jgi:ectoine hydroxylase-related dioxygenase (phytanoyl-CoA dioxygenase family)